MKFSSLLLAFLIIASAPALAAPFSKHEIQIMIKEAEAKTFSDIVREFNIRTQAKKDWLYSMVCLNMAYLQFGGEQGKSGSTTELNRLIRKKLIQYLPSEILKQPGFLYRLQ